MVSMIDDVNYAHDKLGEAISQAKLAGHEFKQACADAIDKVIADITEAIKETEAAPLPDKGFFARLGAKFARYRKTSKLHKEMRFLENVKFEMEKTLIDSYQDAQKLVEKVVRDLRRPYLIGKKLIGPSRSMDALVPNILAAKRTLREKIMQCVHSMDMELDRLRDSFDENTTKASVNNLMSEAAYKDGLKLSQLESINHRARLITAPPVVEAVVPAATEPAVVSVEESEVAAPIYEENVAAPEEIDSTPIAAEVEEESETSPAIKDEYQEPVEALEEESYLKSYEENLPSEDMPQENTLMEEEPVATETVEAAVENEQEALQNDEMPEEIPSAIEDETVGKAEDVDVYEVPQEMLVEEDELTSPEQELTPQEEQMLAHEEEQQQDPVAKQGEEFEEPNQSKSA